MRAIIITGLILLIAIIAALFFLYSLFIEKPKEDIGDAAVLIKEHSLTKKYKLSWKAYSLICVSAFFIILSFFAPLIFTIKTDSEDLNFNATGAIGDTIGGLMNPFIALGGVLITGLAFYAQYKANDMQRELFILNQEDVKHQLQLQIDHQNKQNKMQQLESQFYEMLKLHRENITEMRITGYDFEEGKEEDKRPLKKFEKLTEGRKVFVTMKTELEFILKLYARHYTLDKSGFKKCYSIFFSGLDEYTRRNPTDKEFTDLLVLARVQHRYPSSTTYTNNKRKKYLDGLTMDFNYKPFSGHASRLGHYFRHLYMAVKSVANSTIITDYDDKMTYLRILRAQLSNHEQMMLFYNWISDYGHDWENDTQHFFTEYGMIHNLTWDNLIDNQFISSQVNYLRTRKTNLRKGKMFEIDN